MVWTDRQLKQPLSTDDIQRFVVAYHWFIEPIPEVAELLQRAEDDRGHYETDKQRQYRIKEARKIAGPPPPIEVDLRKRKANEFECDLISQALASTENEIFKEAWGGPEAEVVHDETGDRSMETIGEGLEGQHEPDDDEDDDNQNTYH